MNGIRIMNESGDDPFAKYQAGRAIGASRWLDITQDMVDRFSDVTLDPDPMHIDRAWAERNGPFGGTIAFGFLTVSMLTYFLHDAMGTSSLRDESESGFYLNYGFDRLRLVAPVPTGSRLRGVFTLVDRRTDGNGRHISNLGVVLEIEGGSRPALIADWLVMWVSDRGNAG